MAVQPGELQVGQSQEHLDTVLVDTGTKNGDVHREGVFIGDPENGDARAGVDTDADGSNGRLATSAYIRDRQGKTAKISMKGELLTGQCVDDVDVNFQYIVRTAETIDNSTGTGSVTHPGASGAYALLSPGAGVGRGELVSKAPVRYRGGHEAYCELSWIYRTPEPANWAEFCGFVNGVDQFAIGYENESFGIQFTEGGNLTFVPLGTDSTYGKTIDRLDGTGPSGHNITPQSINVFRLSFVWHGGLPLSVEVQVGQQWWPVFIFDFSNSITETHLENPHLPIGGYIERTAGTGSDEASKTGSWRGGSIASAISEPSDDWTGAFILDVPLVNTAGVITNLLTFHNPDQWQGKQNHIVYELGVVTFRNKSNKDIAPVGMTNATLTGGGAVTFIDESNYALQVQSGGTLTGAAPAPVGGAATILGSDDRERIDVRGTGIKVYPGTTFSIGAYPGEASGANGTFSLATRFIHEG